MMSDIGWTHFVITRLRREAHAWDATIAEGWYVSLRDEQLDGIEPRVGDTISLCVEYPDPPGAPLTQHYVWAMTLGERVMFDRRQEVSA